MCKFCVTAPFSGRRMFKVSFRPYFRFQPGDTLTILSNANDIFKSFEPSMNFRMRARFVRYSHLLYGCVCVYVSLGMFRIRDNIGDRVRVRVRFRVRIKTKFRVKTRVRASVWVRFRALFIVQLKVMDIDRTRFGYGYG